MTVNVCAAFTSSAALGEIEMRASTHVSCSWLESRCSETPATETVVCAEIVVCPVCVDVSVIVQLPVVPTVEHGLGVVKLPTPLSLVKLTCVPGGAFVTPEPLSTETCAVNVRVAFTRSV